MSKKDRPITMAILAMGGEGGGVLADWAVDMAEHSGYHAQTTSVPGVAQRTGTTVYYLEFYPQAQNEMREPVLSTMATPGEVDIVVASELMEAGRALQRGFVTSDVTTLIASTHRVYSMTERTAMGDGRVDSDVLIASCKTAAKNFISADFAKVADESSSVISAALYGALAGSGTLPFTREQFVGAIERGGIGVANSIRAFDRSYAIAKDSFIPVEKPKTAPVSISIGIRPREESSSAIGLTPEQELAIIDDPASVVGSKLKKEADRVKNEFPVSTRLMIVNGIKRTADYQDIDYVTQYLDRLVSVCDAEEKFGDGTYRILNEAARYTALWMTYEDTIRVADLKTRRSRFDRVGKEARVQDEQIMQVREFLHPRSEEIADTLPTAFGRWILKTKFVTNAIEKITAKGMILHTTSLHGYVVLYSLARLKPIRRRSLRFNLEQERIDQWLKKINSLMPTNYDLSFEIVECANVIKGYGDTHANGWRNFTILMAEADRMIADPDASTVIAALRKSALADDDGTQLRQALNL